MKGNGKGYRRTKNGRYEAYISDRCRYTNLGTHDTECEAKNAVSLYKEKQYMRDHCDDNYRIVADKLNRNPETVRKYMARYRKEKYYD